MGSICDKNKSTDMTFEDSEYKESLLDSPVKPKMKVPNGIPM